MANPRYYSFEKDINASQIPDMSSGMDEGVPRLRVEVYYAKDAQRRGMKMSVNRVLVGEHFVRGMPLSKYNACLHLHHMERKNDKVAQRVAKVVSDHIGAICAVALASDSPDWSVLFEILTPHLAAEFA